MVSRLGHDSTAGLMKWDRIIVGVKYCFRYNQRNRARLAGDDPDAVDLAAMPRQRRRREKKLMTMDEVNEKFPLTKYKTWRSTRAEEGLPTAGGIHTMTSRPASIKNLPRVSEDEGKDHEKAQSSNLDMEKEKATSSEPSTPIVAKTDTSIKASEQQPETVTSTTAEVSKTKSHEEEEEDTDQIQTAIPAEQLPDPGDTCAICIDVLEDDDDIRGLTCGHAFHASCVDPWLTSRRACCPLCKADYYTPKPRLEGAEAEEIRTRPSGQDLPPTAFAILTGTGRRRGNRNPTRPPIFAARLGGGRFMSGSPAGQRQRNASINRQAREQSEATVGADSQYTQDNQTPQQQQSWRSRLNLPRLPAISRIRSGRGNETGETPATPSQLEAGSNRNG